MSGTPIEALDLAALLCSRVCHDLISPVGAIVNGLEVLDEDKDEETKTFALDLIKKSASTASAKLQFCRIAFGAAGSAGAQIDLGDAETIARGFLEDDKTKLAWNLPRVLLAKNRVKLLLNLLLIAGQTIPRGGQLTVDPIGAGRDHGLQGQRRRHQCQGSARRCRRCSPATPAARRSMPTASSRSMPASWRKPAASRPPWPWKARRWWSARNSARAVSAVNESLKPRDLSRHSATKIKRFTDTLAALPTESGGRANARRRRRFPWTTCCGNS